MVQQTKDEEMLIIVSELQVVAYILMAPHFNIVPIKPNTSQDEAVKGAEPLLKTQNRDSGCALFQDVQKPSQDEWGKTLDAKEAATALEKNLSQALEDLRALYSGRAERPSL
ncbi:hypothetical protein EI555_015859 [Monodon monoceros]|uniref:Ferritin light chain n=1 Tax=Monodon monoceros TaxID=40151 RepID=A0A4V5P6C5_MONMO|nr:hypothetical protein EI555_015859 [Monodon monoceros]